RPCRAVELPRSFAPGPQSVPAGSWMLPNPSQKVGRRTIVITEEDTSRQLAQIADESGQAVCAADTVTGMLQSRRRGVPDATSPDNSITSLTHRRVRHQLA